MATITTQIKIRRDTATNWSNSRARLAQGEFALDTTNSVLKLGTVDNQSFADAMQVNGSIQESDYISPIEAGYVGQVVTNEDDISLLVPQLLSGQWTLLTGVRITQAASHATCIMHVMYIYKNDTSFNVTSLGADTLYYCDRETSIQELFDSRHDLCWYSTDLSAPTIHISGDQIHVSFSQRLSNSIIRLKDNGYLVYFKTAFMDDNKGFTTRHADTTPDEDSSISKDAPWIRMFNTNHDDSVASNAQIHLPVDGGSNCFEGFYLHTSDFPIAHDQWQTKPDDIVGVYNLNPYNVKITNLQTFEFNNYISGIDSAVTLKFRFYIMAFKSKNKSRIIGTPTNTVEIIADNNARTQGDIRSVCFNML